MIILLAVLIPSDSPIYFIAVFIAIVLLSVFAYHLVEDPIRKSNWLSGKSHEQKRRERRGKPLYGPGTRYLLLSMLLIGTATVVVVASLPQPTAPNVSPYSAVVATADPAADAPVVSAASASRTLAIQQALTQTAWPTISPSLDDFGDSGLKLAAPEWIDDGCLAEANAREDDPIANAGHCTYGNSDADAAHTAVLYGDSIAISWAQGIRSALGDSWKVVVYTMSGCPMSTLDVTTSSGAPYPECTTFRNWVFDQVDQIKPALTITSEAIVYERLADKLTGSSAVAELRAGTDATLSRLSPSSGRVVLLSRPPASTPLIECYTPRSTPANCVSQISDDFNNEAKVYSNAAAADSAKVTFIDVRSWFCFAGNCPSFIGGTTVKADRAHLTAPASAALAPLLAEVLLPTAAATPAPIAAG